MSENEKRPVPDTDAVVSVWNQKMEDIYAGGQLCREQIEDQVWNMIAALAGQPFYTAKGLEYTYTIKGYEMFISRKEKSITRASVNIALKNAMELRGQVTGPKKLNVFGASYLYPVFQKIGVIREKTNVINLEGTNEII